MISPDRPDMRRTVNELLKAAVVKSGNKGLLCDVKDLAQINDIPFRSLPETVNDLIDIYGIRDALKSMLPVVQTDSAQKQLLSRQERMDEVKKRLSGVCVKARRSSYEAVPLDSHTLATNGSRHRLSFGHDLRALASDGSSEVHEVSVDDEDSCQEHSDVGIPSDAESSRGSQLFGVREGSVRPTYPSSNCHGDDVDSVTTVEEATCSVDISSNHADASDAGVASKLAQTQTDTLRTIHELGHQDKATQISQTASCESKATQTLNEHFSDADILQGLGQSEGLQHGQCDIDDREVTATSGASQAPHLGSDINDNSNERDALTRAAPRSTIFGMREVADPEALAKAEFCAPQLGEHDHGVEDELSIPSLKLQKRNSRHFVEAMHSSRQGTSCLWHLCVIAVAFLCLNLALYRIYAFQSIGVSSCRRLAH